MSDSVNYRLDIRALIKGPATRLRYVRRFSTCRVAHPESVAEHSYFTALYTMLICRWLEQEQILETPWSLQETRTAIESAILHDLEECVTGDLPRTFKHADQKLHDALNIAAQKCIVSVASTFSARKDYRDPLIALWRHAKGSSRPGRVVAFADFLSALSYLAQELWDHNDSMREHAASIRDYIDSFSGEEFDFIRSLVVQTEVLISEIFGEQN